RPAPTTPIPTRRVTPTRRGRRGPSYREIRYWLQFLAASDTDRIARRGIRLSAIGRLTALGRALHSEVDDSGRLDRSARRRSAAAGRVLGRCSRLRAARGSEPG